MRNIRYDTHLRTVMREQFFPLNPKIRHPHTRYQYEKAVSDLSDALGRAAQLGDLSDDNVCRMMRHLQDAGLATRTINERRGRINTLWEWLARRGYVKHFPTVKRLPEPVRTPQAWTKDQLAQLFMAVNALEGSVGTTQERLWWRALLLVLWDSGERIGAVLSIGWQHVDLDSRWLTIPAELRKGKARDMTYRLHPDTVEALRFLPRHEKVFHWPLDHKYIWARFGTILKSAGLPSGRKDKFHRMRRSVASHYEAAGGNATNLLGHSTRKTTQGYLDPKIIGSETAIDRLFRPETLAPSERERKPPQKEAG